MNWVTQNAIWIVLAIGVAWFFLRGRRGGGGHGSGHGHHGGHHHGSQGPAQPGTAIDPVGGQPVDLATAVTSVHGGTTYYFASKENRERFEAAPAQYVQDNAGTGPHGGNHRRHGC